MSKDKPSQEGQDKKEENEETLASAPHSRKFLSQPILGVLGIIGSIASLISIPLAIYFYFEAKDYPQLTYFVYPVRSILVRAGQSSRLTASYDNNVIQSDITTAQVALWNRGKQSIKKGNILKAIEIYTENNTPILEATIRKTARDVTQLTLNTDHIEQGRVIVSWEILEQDDGGIIQLIYAGNPDLKILVKGTIEGQKELSQFEPPNPNNESRDFQRDVTISKIFGLFFMSLGFFSMGVVIWALVKTRIQWGTRKRVTLSSIGVAVVFILFIGLGIFYFIIGIGMFSFDNGPPFGL